jgi:hypothetical protein
MNVNESFATDIFKNLIKKPANSAMKEIKKGFGDFLNMLEKVDTDTQKKVLSGINKSLGSNFRSIKDLKSMSKSRLGESERVNEDWKHWWDQIKDQGWFNITFYPALQTWFEVANLLGNFFKNEPLDIVTVKKAAFYGVLWLALATGKFIKDFYKWKKENPEEYSKERKKAVPMTKRELVKFT